MIVDCINLHLLCWTLPPWRGCIFLLDDDFYSSLLLHFSGTDVSFRAFTDFSRYIIEIELCRYLLLHAISMGKTQINMRSLLFCFLLFLHKNENVLLLLFITRKKTHYYTRRYKLLLCQLCALPIITMVAENTLKTSCHVFLLKFWLPILMIIIAKIFKNQ